MADYNLNAEITADASGFESGIKKAQKASKNLSNSVSSMIKGLGKNGLVGALGAVGLASGGVSAILGTLTKVARKVSETISECSEAYRKQYKAEIALATAVNNNPYVDGTATKRLQEFASEMQKVSDVGDEQLMPMMAQLIATGRTEEETMQIMSVALDMSASGAMSLDTAITQLNATLNGNVGRLGQQNAELKNLTEEELRQGKAVEILGAKYKGLAQSTADTQKQLKNAVGDLKENLGQVFETALAPMRRYFTEVITNLNNSITKSRELKKAMKEVFSGEGVNVEATTESLNVAFSETLHKQQEVTKNYQQYLQLYGAYIDQATDETVLSYKKQIADLNAQLKTISEELNKRRKASEDEKKKLAQSKADEEKQRELEETEKLLAKKLALQTEWQDKLFAQRIEQLERARDYELENEELTEEMKNGIREFYMQQIVTMKVAQLEKERDEILKNEELTEEARIAIQNYYSNRIQNVREDEAKKIVKIKEKENEQEKKIQKKTFKEMVDIAKQYTNNVAKAFENVSKTIKSVFSGIGRIFSNSMKLFKFNPDDILVSLLKIEDTILTFFVFTLPRLPKFFKSALESVLVLLKNLVTNVDWAKIQEVINNLVDLIIEYTPDIVTNLLDVIIHVAQALLDGLIRFINNGGWKMILDMLLTIQKRIEDFVTENIDQIVDTIVAMLPDLIQFLIDSIVSASKAFKKLIRPLIKLIMALVEAVIEVLLSDEVFEAGLDALLELIDAINEELLPRIAYLIPKLIVKIIGFVVKNLPKLVVGIVEGLIKAFFTVNWFDVVKEIFMGFIDGFKELFGIHSPSTLFEGFGQNIIEGLVEGLKGLAEALNTMLMPLYDFVVNVIGKIIDAFDAIGVQVNTLTNSTFKGFVDMIKASGEPMRVMGKVTIAVMGAIGRTLADIHNLIRDIIHELTTIKVWTPWDTYEIGGVDIGTVTPPDMTPYINLVNALKDGTDNARKGLTLVGEAGPELVEFNGGERVLNNRNTNKALENMGGNTNNFNVTFNNMQDTSAFAMMQQLKQYNRQMAINGVI